MPALSPNQADAAVLRGIGERMQARGEDGLWQLAFQLARWTEDCDPPPADLVEGVLAGLGKGGGK